MQTFIKVPEPKKYAKLQKIENPMFGMQKVVKALKRLI